VYSVGVSEVEKEFQFYLANQDALVSKYNGKYVVIKDESVVESFDKELDAYHFATGRFEPGTFIIQCVAPGTDSHTQTFHSRVGLAV
jgi:hypothetical protein